MTGRREFLRHAAAAAAGLPVLSALAAVRDGFAHTLEAAELDRYRASNFAALREEYLLADGVVYLNHASIGTVPRIVHEARVEYLRVCESNPWLYMWGGAWEEPREEVRRKAAAVYGCPPDRMTITHNTTEAFNILANGLPLGSGDEVVFSSLNHTGASAPFFHAARTRGFTVRRFQFPLLDVPRMAADDVVEAYVAALGPATRLLVFPAIDNIVGIRYPVARLAAAARDHGVEWIAVDGAQSVGMIPTDVGSMGVDVYATSPHKWLQAPKGLGLCFFSERIQNDLRPMWVTWGQNQWQGTARQYEDYGTRNLAEALTLGDAIDFQRRLSEPDRQTRLRALWEHTRRRVDAHPAAGWASPPSWELSTSIYGVSLRGPEANALSQEIFERHGIVLRPFNTQGLNAVRLSPNVFTTEEEIDRFFGAVGR